VLDDDIFEEIQAIVQEIRDLAATIDDAPMSRRLQEIAGEVLARVSVTE
jgi:hypothetical protein